MKFKKLSNWLQYLWLIHIIVALVFDLVAAETENGRWNDAKQRKHNMPLPKGIWKNPFGVSQQYHSK